LGKAPSTEISEANLPSPGGRSVLPNVCFSYFS
jgi:hypothetical protein